MHNGMIMIEAGAVKAVTANLDLLLEGIAPTAVADTHIMKMTVVIVKTGNEALDTMLLSIEIREIGGDGHGASS